MMTFLRRAASRAAFLRRSDLTIARDASISGSTLGHLVRIGPRSTLIRSSLGDRTYIGPDCSLLYARIGKYCSLAGGVHVGLGTHPTSFVATHPIFYLRRPSLGFDFSDRDYHQEFRPSTVGNDVWIGLRSAVRDGVRVGDGAVIAAGAIVTRDVPPYAIVAGIPARIVRYRFPPEVIGRLLESRWWDKDEAWLRQHWRAFHDVRAFLDLFPGPHRPPDDPQNGGP